MSDWSDTGAKARELANDPAAFMLHMSREHLLPFAAFMHRGKYKAPRHIRRLADALERVESGEIKRLIIAMPPRHGKSMTVSETFPAWYLGRHPEDYILASSYGQDLADRVGRKVRNMMAGKDFTGLFPEAELSDDSAAARRFSTKAGGEYYAVGVGGPATGRGADVLICDDPIKNREEADSPTVRGTLRDWYAAVAYTRLMPGGAIIIVATRWHEGDLTGWLLEEHGHENWTVLEMPAINEDGEALWPEAYDVPQLRMIEKTLGPREWSALYQQKPSPAEGLLFKTAQIDIVDALPIGTRMVRGWDLAATAAMGTNDPDWTVGALVGVDPDGFFYIAGMARMRGSPMDVERLVLQTASIDGVGVPISLPQDPGQAGKMQATYYIRKLAGHTVEATPESGDKSTRAAPLAAQVEAGNVRMLRGPWNRELLNEMSTFPAGRHDDQVDAVSRAFGKLTTGLKQFVPFSGFGPVYQRSINLFGE